MGKYQLDDKGKALVQRFHEKEESKKAPKANNKKDLQTQFLEKLKRKA